MNQKILIISPTPTHPTNAGNRSRIFTYSKFLIDSGHEVHFLYSGQEDSDIDAMVNYWGTRFHYVSYQAPQKREYNKYLQLLNPNVKYYSHVDDHYNELMDAKIDEIKKEITFTAVVIEYIFNTKALFNFGKDVLKVVDTHDVMTNRHKQFLKAGKPAIWYSTSKKEERKGINRADVVMAIQDVEAAFYRTMTSKRVITVGHLVNVVVPVKKNHPDRSLLFVGSSNPSNYYGVIDFRDGYFPVLREKYPDLKLYLAGNICKVIDDYDGVVKLGEVDDLADAYKVADIVINPLTIGTGLKIKMIEALGYGKAVISTSTGAEGLEDGLDKAFLVADNITQFTKCLDRLFTDSIFYSGIVNEAIAFAHRYNMRQNAELQNLFSR